VGELNSALSGTISVCNNGLGIPVVMHAVENVWVPELIFGHLLTSSNYDDTQKRVTGGRNGYGAKLTNIYSTRFVVETADGSRSGKQYKQVFLDNMSVTESPTITKCGAKANWTRITFQPDWKRFGMTHLDKVGGASPPPAPNGGSAPKPPPFRILRYASRCGF
jgi:DNA topoisomerase-2